MTDRRTRSDHFLWQQQRLREQSDRKHADQIRNDRERFYNYRDADARRAASRGSGPGIGPFLPFIWFLTKWFFALMLWNVLCGFVNGPTTFLGIVITVIFVFLTIVKQVRRFKKRVL